jgi:O-antigen/teichoic acid export membrane protein
MEGYQRKVKLNALSSYFNLFINSLTLLLISPLLVRFLGDMNFGIWKSIQRILSITSVADGQSGQALKSFIANSQSNVDYDRKRRLIGSALKVSLYFMPLTFVLVGCIVYFLPSLMNDIPEAYVPVIRFTGFILGINLIITPLLAIPDSILIGTNNLFTLNKVQIFTTVLMNCLFLLVAFLDYGIIGLAYVSMIVLVLNGLLVYLICKKKIHWFGFRKPQKDEVKIFFNFSFWILLWSFLERLLLSTEIFLIGYLITPVEVTNYSISAYAIQLVVPIALFTGSAFIPSLGNFVGQKDLINSRKVIYTIKSALTIISVVFGCGIVLFNNIFVKLWIGKDYYLGDFNNFLMVIIMVQLLLLRNDSQIKDITLNVKMKVIYGALGTFLVFLFAILSYSYYPNISSIFLSIIVGRLLMTIVFRKQVNSFFNIPVVFKDEISVFLLVSFTYVLFAYFLIDSLITKVCYFLLLLFVLFKYFGGKALFQFIIKK